MQSEKLKIEKRLFKKNMAEMTSIVLCFFLFINPLLAFLVFVLMFMDKRFDIKIFSFIYGILSDAFRAFNGSCWH